MNDRKFKSVHSERNRQRQLERTLRHALALAGGGWAAQEALHHQREGGHQVRQLGRLGRLVGFGTLAGYILHRYPAARPKAGK
jgi:hypothetical protein